jgi:hypothetical protein
MNALTTTTALTPVRAHARLAPSAASRWMRCSMSVRAQERAGERPSSWHAEEGSLAHAFAAWMLEGFHRDATEFVGQRLALSEYAEPQLLLREMAEGVNEYLDYCWSVVDRDDDVAFVVERRVTVPTPHAEEGAIFGTTDFAAFSPSGGWLEQVDFKYGAGYAVPVDTPQLPIYAIGTIATLGWVPKLVRLVIVQPRAFHRHGEVRTRVMSIFDLVSFALELDGAVDRVVNDPAYDVGGHCRYCSAAWDCPALVKHVFDRLPLEGGLPDPKEMTMDQLKRAMDTATMLELWVREVRAEAQNRLAADPNAIDGYKLVERQARRKWDGDDEVLAKEIAAEFGLDADKLLRRKMMGITDTEKLVFKGKRGEARRAAEISMAKFTVRDSSGYEVTRMDDDRPVVSVAADAFAGVKIPGNLPPPADEAW